MSFTTQLPAAQEYVYVIHAKSTNRIKLGFSKTPQRRLAELQTAAPFELQMLACWPGSRKREDRLHRYMSQFRKVGEWFEVPPFIGLKLWELVHKGEVTGKVQKEKNQTVMRPKKARKIPVLKVNLDGLDSADREWLLSSSYDDLVAFNVRFWRIEESGHKRNEKTYKQVLRYAQPRISVFCYGLTPELEKSFAERPGRGRRIASRQSAMKDRLMASAIAERIMKYRKGSWDGEPLRERVTGTTEAE